MDHTYNDELRMMGLLGDDEDDLGGEELLGANFAVGGVHGRRSKSNFYVFFLFCVLFLLFLLCSYLIVCLLLL
jgi:hypothetical protein